jgi:hypothetical protein
MIELRLPTLLFGESAATIVGWHAKPGARLAIGDPLVVVLSERCELALTAPHNATLAEVVAGPGASVAPGDVIARLAPAESVPRTRPTPRRVTPLAHRMAVVHHLDLNSVDISPQGRLTSRDLHRLFTTALPPPQREKEAAGEWEPATPRPASLLLVEVDLTNALKLLTSLDLGSASGQPTMLLALLVYAAAHAARVDTIAIQEPSGWRHIPGIRDHNLRGVFHILHKSSTIQPDPPETAIAVAYPHSTRLPWAPAALPLIGLGPVTRKPIALGSTIIIRSVAALSLSSAPEQPLPQVAEQLLSTLAHLLAHPPLSAL